MNEIGPTAEKSDTIRLMGCPFEINSGELEKDFGFKPRITIEQGLESFRRFYGV